MHEESAKSAPAAPDWASAWFDMLSKASAAMPSLGAAVPPEIVRQLQTAQLKWWSDHCSEFLRSPGFLKAMKDSMAAATQSREQANKLFGELHHAFQGATREDIDHLSRSLRRHQEDVGAALRDIRRRLSDLSRRVAALKNGQPANGDAVERSPANPPPAQRRKRPAKRREK
jgi:hypothetical protein